MSGTLCIGGICIPYSAIIPGLLILLKWLTSLLLGEQKQKGGSSSCCCATEDCSSQKLKPRRSKLGKSASALTKASATGGRGTDGTVIKISDAAAWSATIGASKGRGRRAVVVKFTATWCKPCKDIDPHYHTLAKNYDGTFVKVDVDELDEVAAECSVSMMPTFSVFVDGSTVGTVTGANEGKLEHLVRQHCPERVRD